MHSVTDSSAASLTSGIAKAVRRVNQAVEVYWNEKSSVSINSVYFVSRQNQMHLT